MKIKFTNNFDKNKKNFKAQNKEIEIKGDCKITNYGKDYTPSNAGDITINITGENAEIIKGAKTPENDKNTVHFGNNNYSIFTTIASMSQKDKANELTLDDLQALKDDLDNGKPKNKTLLNLGVTKVLCDIKNGVVSIMVGDKVVLRIDFETESEKTNKSNQDKLQTKVTQQKNKNKELTSDEIFRTRAIEGGMNIEQFSNAKKYIEKHFPNFDLVNVRRDKNAKVATLVISDNNVEFHIKYQEGMLVEDIAEFKKSAQKGGMNYTQFSDALDYIKTTYKDCIIKNVKQDPNAKAVTFVLNNKQEVKYIDGVLQTNEANSASDLTTEKEVTNKILAELKKVNAKHGNKLTTEDYLYVRDNLKWKEWGITALRVDPSRYKVTIILKSGTTIRKDLKVDTKKDNNIGNNISEKKDTRGFLKALSGQETRGKTNPHMVINYAGYVGLYQMGEQAMIEMGIYSKDPDGYCKNGTPYYNNDWSGVFKKNKYNISSLWDYRNSPEKQEALQIDYKKKDWKYIKNLGLNKYIGKEINGQKITASGLLAGAHLVGVGGLKKYLNGDYTVADGSGTKVSQYISQFADYDIKEITG